jgi:arginine/lysine/histidine/glutamine transport system substrate-binding and permease protein
LTLHLEPVAKGLPVLIGGLMQTYIVTVIAFAIALVLGLGIALMRISPYPQLRAIAAAYVTFFRGIPQLALLLWVYFGIAAALGTRFDAFTAAVGVLAIQSAAYLSEVYRAGLLAIPKTQLEAAAAVGLSPVQSFRYVVFIQALRIIVPPAGNEAISLLKGSTLVSVLGVFELTRITQQQVNFYSLPFEFYGFAALAYLASAVVIGRVFTFIEHRVAF